MWTTCIGWVLASAAPGQRELWELRGVGQNDSYGTAIARVGDLNADGVDDLLIGAPQVYPFRFGQGYVEVRSGKDRQVLLRVHGSSRGAGYGSAVAGVGDVDRDGKPDFAVGAPRDSVVNVEGGRAWVLSGRDGSQLAVVAGANHNDRLGTAVAGVGDVDLDGVPDFAVGNDRGAVILFSGKDAKPVRSLVGNSVAGPGDVDGDGTPDILVGQVASSTARVFSGKDGKELLVLRPTASVSEFGFSVAGAGDVDRDGRPDLLVGSRALLAMVFSGRDGKALHVLDPGRVIGQFGQSVAGPGDVDGDGHADLLVGASMQFDGPGCALLFSGRSGNVLSVFTGMPFDKLGLSVAGLGDVDGDGMPDIAAASPQAPAFDGVVRAFAGSRASLIGTPEALSIQQGGVQTLLLQAGAPRAGGLAFLLGTLSGPAPGVRLGAYTLPLNFDAYTDLLIANPNVLLVPQAVRLGDSGAGAARLRLPAGLPAALVGMRMHHAFAVLGRAWSLDFASSPAVLNLVQ